MTSRIVVLEMSTDLNILYRGRDTWHECWDLRPKTRWSETLISFRRGSFHFFPCWFRCLPTYLPSFLYIWQLWNLGRGIPCIVVLSSIIKIWSYATYETNLSKFDIDSVSSNKALFRIKAKLINVVPFVQFFYVTLYKCIVINLGRGKIGRGG